MRAVLVATLLIVASVMMLPPSRSAEAKSSAFVITGGNLGQYAYHFFVGPDKDIVLADGGAGQAASDPLPALAYDLYPSWGNFAVPFQLASGAPEFRYYPGPGLIHRTIDNVWLRASKPTLDQAVSEALARKAAGGLELGPVAADFRARHMPEFVYHVNSYSAADPAIQEAGLQEMWRSAESRGAIYQPEARAFIMRELVETVSGPPKFPSTVPPQLAIFYSGRVGDTGYGGILGVYAPREDARPGRFWPEDANFFDTGPPYYETTAGFDAMIAEAMAQPQSARPVEEDAAGGDRVGPIAAAVAAGAVALLGGGWYLRRRLSG